MAGPCPGHAFFNALQASTESDSFAHILASRRKRGSMTYGPLEYALLSPDDWFG
jgi:hypothetical protein